MTSCSSGTGAPLSPSVVFIWWGKFQASKSDSEHSCTGCKKKVWEFLPLLTLFQSYPLCGRNHSIVIVFNSFVWWFCRASKIKQVTVGPQPCCANPSIFQCLLIPKAKRILYPGQLNHFIAIYVYQTPTMQRPFAITNLNTYKPLSSIGLHVRTRQVHHVTWSCSTGNVCSTWIPSLWFVPSSYKNVWFDSSTMSTWGNRCPWN